uniref:centrosomal protein of 55 kDa-like isoform X2 n=1 Tax=Nyctereutes procyonoides TaxID=34880 RepID=UPI0024447994|nr:centrosomal protein of 55 kDa-like isoform X2 [Nyctereutes procyonoides]
MSSRSPKDFIKSKWGSKPSNSKSETALEKLKGEISALKTSVDEITSGKGKLTDKDRHRLLETMATSCFNSSMNNIHEMEIQLKDALEKNQQWLVYDQQREVYVKGLLAKIFELEQKLETAAHSCPQQTKKAESEDFLQEEKQKYYNHLLANAKRDLEVERQTITQLNFELSEFQRKYEETQKEVQDLNQLLSSQRKADVQHLEDDRHKTEKIQRLKEEYDITREKLEEEKKRSEELFSQVQFLYTSLLKHQEEQTRIVLLEQQKQLLELALLTEPLVTFQGESENRVKVASPKTPTAALNESLVECPTCDIQYPATEHRDLLVHVEYCSN